MKKWIEGYRQFYQAHFSNGDGLYPQLVRQGQQPEIMIIACSDSRTDPSILLGAGPGELFQVRNVGNLVPAYSYQDHACGVAAALIFAVEVLKVRHIIVLGHTHCGGIQTLMKADKDIDPQHQGIRDWASIAMKAKEQTVSDYPDASFAEMCQHCELASIKHSLLNLRSFPFVDDAVGAGLLQLHGWIFDLDSGKIKAYQSEKDVFHDVTDNAISDA